MACISIIIIIMNIQREQLEAQLSNELLLLYS